MDANHDLDNLWREYDAVETWGPGTAFGVAQARAGMRARIIEAIRADERRASEERERVLRADIHRALAGARYRGEALVVSTLEYILRGEKSALLIPENAGDPIVAPDTQPSPPESASQ